MPVKHLPRLLIICLSLLSVTVAADEVEYVVTGVDEPMMTNVLNHVSAFRIGGGARLNARLRRRLIADAEIAAANAMRPFGYFHPEISVAIQPGQTGQWLLTVAVKAGPPVIVRDILLELTGEGSELASLLEWKSKFPLAEGQTLNQHAWDRAKHEVIGILDAKL